jgi:DNA-binding NtrC family response regulator
MKIFIAKSKYLKKIKELADMAKELKLSIYIWGERGVGKSFLARYISPDAIINKPSTTKPVIIEDFDKNPSLNFKNPFLIATGTKPLSKEIIKKYFSIDIELKPLREHKEDILEFAKYFKSQAQEELKIQKEISFENLDISENLNSLKRDIYKRLLLPSNKEEIFDILKDIYKINHKTYEEELCLFERTLFSAMKEKYTSKLKISEKLKINRVTLTKKMRQLDV